MQVLSLSLRHLDLDQDVFALSWRLCTRYTLTLYTFVEENGLLRLSLTTTKDFVFYFSKDLICLVSVKLKLYTKFNSQ